MKRAKKIIPIIIFCSVFIFVFAMTPASAHAAANVDSFSSLQAALSDISSTIDITVVDSFNLTDTVVIPAGKDVTINSDSTTWTLTRNSGFTGDMFSVSSGATLTLNNIILDGNKNAFSNGIGSIVKNSGTLYINNGAILQNNWGYTGGGINNTAGSTLTMSGGSIANNKAAGYGGGIFNANDSTLTMTGGSINNNATEEYGGGVCNYGAVYLSDTADISRNAVRRAGGGIFNANLVNMSGGSITDNEDEGIFNNGIGIVNMSGGSIADNQSDRGAGIYNNSVINISGGSIANNIATYSGGGIYNNGIVNLSGTGSISGNSSANGGAIFNSGGTVDITGGSIIDNKAANGGGIYNISNGIIKMSAGSITDNGATIDGGGIFHESGTFTMTGGTIAKNSADDKGAGLYSSGAFALGGSASIGTALGTGNGVYLDFDEIIEIESGYAGFANIEAVANPYLGRVIAQGSSPYTAQEADLDKFYYMPSDYDLKFDGATNQIVLGEPAPVVETPTEKIPATGGADITVYLFTLVLSLFAVGAVIPRRMKSKR